MGQPVKLSDILVADARMVGELTERSIAGQIEFWAGLGRAIEPLLGIEGVLALKRSGQARSIEDCLAEVDTPMGRAKLKAVLEAGPYPHYEAAPERPGWLLRTEEDGTRKIGRFVDRQFVEASEP